MTVGYSDTFADPRGCHFNSPTTVYYFNKITSFKLHGKGLTLVALLEAVKRCRPSFLILGSHHYVQLSEFDLSSTKVSSNDLNSVKAIVANGSAVPPICKHKLRKIFPLSALHLHGYGQTETYVFTVGLMEYNGLGAIDPRATLKVKFNLCHIY